MKTNYKIGILFVLMAMCSFNTFGDDTTPPRHGERRPGPPPEAYTACEGKTAGDAVEMEGPQGDTISGTCIQEGDKLVLRPDNLKGGSGGRDNAPPEEAIEACEGKSDGDTGEFINEEGDTVTGTCEQHGDQLVLRLDRPQH